MTEHARAKQWRLRYALTMDDLAELVGYSVSAISWMERGLSPSRPGQRAAKVRPYVWQRYKAACAGADAQLKSKRKFDW